MTDDLRRDVNALTQRFIEIQLEHEIHAIITRELVAVIRTHIPEANISELFEGVYAETLLHFDSELTPEMADKFESYFNSFSGGKPGI